MKRYWIKLFIEVLDDPKMGRMGNHLWRRAVECFLLAGRQGDDGALPPVEEMAWILRLSEDKLLEDLHDLAEAGVVHEAEPGKWVATHFARRQAAMTVEERVRRFREGNKTVTDRYKNCNEGGGEVSTSTSDSESVSDSLRGVEVQEKGGDAKGMIHQKGTIYRAPTEEPGLIPQTPAEASRHPDIRVFQEATGGRIPGLSQYGLVIDSVRLLRERMGDAPQPEGCGVANGGLSQRDASPPLVTGTMSRMPPSRKEAALVNYLQPYWLAWRSRKRKDGREYDQGNITWLTEWAVNGVIPEGTIGARAGDQEAIRQVAMKG